jgi:hypothetical protein
MIKLIDLLKENNISDKIMSWIDTGDFSSNEAISDELANYLDEEGYKDKGVIYRVFFFSKDELMSFNSMYMKDFILKRDNGKFKSFCKDYSGVEYILKHYAEHEDRTVVIKQTSDYYDLLQLIEDKYNELEFDDEIVGEVENTQEVIAKISTSLEVVKLISK